MMATATQREALSCLELRTMCATLGRGLSCLEFRPIVRNSWVGDVSR